MENSVKLLLSVIVVNHNSEKYLHACLDSVRKHFSDISFEIIIVDSSEKKLEQLPLDVLYFQIPNRGFGSANNYGVSKSNGKYVLFLNPDTQWKEGKISTALNVLERFPRIGLLGFRLIDAKGNIQKWSAGLEATLLDTILNNIGFIRSKSIWESDRPKLAAWVSGAAMLMRKNDFEKLGGFDEKYFLYFEDADIGKRLRSQGKKILHIPFIKIIHHSGSTMSSTVFQKKHYYESQNYYFSKYNSRFKVFLIKLLRKIFA